MRHSSNKRANIFAKPPVSCAICVLRQRTLYQKAQDSGGYTLDSLRVGQVTVKKGQVIVSQEAQGGTAYTLYSGWAIRYRQLRNGRRQILSFYLPGDVIGFEATRSVRWEFGVRALTDVALCEFNTEELYSFLTHQPESRRHLLDAGCAVRLEADKRTISMSRLSAAERMVTLIQRLRVRQIFSGSSLPKFFFLPLRRYDFADALGLTPVHVSRTLSHFRQENILSIRQQTATILDEEKFHALCKEG